MTDKNYYDLASMLNTLNARGDLQFNIVDGLESQEIKIVDLIVGKEGLLFNLSLNKCEESHKECGKEVNEKKEIELPEDLLTEMKRFWSEIQKMKVKMEKKNGS